MLRKMKVEDLPSILEIEKELFSSPWKEEDFLFELTQNPFARYTVLLEQNEVVGYIGYWLKEPYVEITNVAVRSSYQRQGYAKKLVASCIEEGIKSGSAIFTLEVRFSNIPAIQLYESFGFKSVTVRKNYYTDPIEDAYLMMKEVKE